MSKPFDSTAKDLIEADPSAFLALLGIVEDGPIRVVDANLSTITAEADKALRVDGPTPWLIHFEFQADRDPSMAGRMLRYNVLLGHRHEVPVLSVLILLRRVADSPSLDGRVVRALPDGREYLDFRYSVVRLWEQPVDPVLDGPIGTLPSAPLCDVTQEDVPEILRAIDERLRDGASPADLGRLRVATQHFLGLRLKHEEAARLIGEAFMELMPIKIHGYEEALRQVAIEGDKIEGGVQIIMKMGRQKFGEPSPEILKRMRYFFEMEQVEKLADRLFTATSWDDLLGPPPPPLDYRRK